MSVATASRALSANHTRVLWDSSFNSQFSVSSGFYFHGDWTRQWLCITWRVLFYYYWAIRSDKLGALQIPQPRRELRFPLDKNLNITKTVKIFELLKTPAGGEFNPVPDITTTHCYPLAVSTSYQRIHFARRRAIWKCTSAIHIPRSQIPVRCRPTQAESVEGGGRELFHEVYLFYCLYLN